jgi:hypothetical protein
MTGAVECLEPDTHFCGHSTGIAAAQVALNLGPIGPTIQKESQVRVLAPLPAEEQRQGLDLFAFR